MKKNHYRKPPFSLDRGRYGDLADQLASSLRTAIETGYYKAGDILPPVRDLAALLDVSKGIAEQALSILREDGLVSPRPAVGSVVCPKDRPLWKGQVLIVVPPGIGNLRENSVYAILRDALTSAGYMPLVATVPRTPEGKFVDFALLEAMLRQQVNLTVCLHDAPSVVVWLSKRKIPFVLFGRNAARSRGSVGFVDNRDDSVLGEFIAHCHEARVSSVLQLTAIENGPDAVSALKAAGIKATNWRIAPPNGGNNALGLVQRATDVFAARLAKGRKWLPDLLFFRDDHLATGALVALSVAGVRIPEDVRVVTWANRDIAPAFVKPLTRIELDSAAIGERLAECVLEYLATGLFPKDVVVGPKYVRGETF